MQDRILFIDTETGGLDPNTYSLLSIAFVLWKDFSIIDQIEIPINDGIFNVEKKAMEINKIDLEKHRIIALEPKEAIKKMKDFLFKHFSRDQKITLAGHNINFDVNFLRMFLEKNDEKFDNYFSHRFVDTSSILYYLYLAGKLKKRTISSDEAFKMFKIKVDNRHTALSDAIGTANLFTELISLLKKKLNVKIIDYESTTLFDNSFTSNISKPLKMKKGLDKIYKKILEPNTFLKRKNILYYFNSAFESKGAYTPDLALFCTVGEPLKNDKEKIEFYITGKDTEYADELIESFGFEKAQQIPENLFFILGLKYPTIQVLEKH